MRESVSTSEKGLITFESMLVVNTFPLHPDTYHKHAHKLYRILSAIYSSSLK